MKYSLKLSKSKFYDKSIRLVIYFLIVGFCISGAGCVMPPVGGAPGPEIGFTALIQPLLENHGRWSKEEVDTVIAAIVSAATHHGLKKKWAVDSGYTLSSKYFELELNARIVYFKDTIYHYSPSLVEAQSSSPFRHLSLRKLNIQKEKGTIRLTLWYLTSQSTIPDSERLLVKNIWNEVVGPLRDKFGERMEEGRNIEMYDKIYGH